MQTSTFFLPSFVILNHLDNISGGQVLQKAEEKAVACYQSGNFAAALRSFLNVLAEDPKREDILVYIANCYDGLGQKEEAVAYYRKALKAN